MRCRACNKALTDIESRRKDPITGEYFDLCATDYAHYKQTLNELVDDSGITYRTDLIEIET
jgi:hypothetical protein